MADEVTAQDQLPLAPADKKAFFQSSAGHVFRLLPATGPASPGWAATVARDW